MGLVLGCVGFLFLVPLCFIGFLYITMGFGIRSYVGSPFLLEIDSANGIDHSFLQGRDAASFVSGTKFKWGEIGTQKVDKCDNSFQYSPAECKMFQLPSSGQCYTCSFQADTQDYYYSLVFIKGSRLTEFNSINHDFLLEPPSKLGQYFSFPDSILR